MHKTNQSGFSPIHIVGILFVIIVIGFIGLRVAGSGSKKNKDNSAATASQTSNQTTQPPASSSTNQTSQSTTTSQQSTDTKADTRTTAPTCTGEYQLYQSKELGVQFCKGIYWGNLEYSTIESSKGSAIRVTIPGFTPFQITAASTDWAKKGASDECRDPFSTRPDFSLTPELLKWFYDGEVATSKHVYRYLETDSASVSILERADATTGGICLRGDIGITTKIGKGVSFSYFKKFDDNFPSVQEFAKSEVAFTSLDRETMHTIINSFATYQP